MMEYFVFFEINDHPMRPLEVAGTIGLFLYTPHLDFPWLDQEALFACLLLLVIARHLWFEGYRWQMAPAIGNFPTSLSFPRCDPVLPLRH
jgi:hypothetical protein